MEIMLQILTGDAVNMLRTLPDESVNCCVTSPPYYGLRDYGVDGQIGLESTPEQYIEKMVAVFREVRRVLRDDGTLWLNLGDSYSGGSGCHAGGSDKQNSNIGATNSFLPNKSGVGLKPKDLIGIPWMLAFALRADGWYLRQDIIWAKPNQMPESVRDRCTKSHEYIFLLTKSARYWYDAEAIQEPIADSTAGDSRLYRDGYDTGRPERGFPGSAQHGSGLLVPKSWKGSKFHDGKNLINHPNVGMKRSGNKEQKQRPCAGVLNIGAQAGSVPWEGLTRNRRSVWNITTKPYKDAHFATFPPELPRICIMAGCPVGGVVLDPFAGSGTTGAVAIELGRRAVLIELNEKYVDMIKRRTKTTIGMAL
jgi:DNA modification methylase